jgi:hypothetical protein
MDNHADESPGNRFLVGSQGRNAVILGMGGVTISKTDALNLAAWLVIVSDESEGYRDFLALLTTIDET